MLRVRDYRSIILGARIGAGSFNKFRRNLSEHLQDPEKNRSKSADEKENKSNDRRAQGSAYRKWLLGLALLATGQAVWIWYKQDPKENIFSPADFETIDIAIYLESQRFRLPPLGYLRWLTSFFKSGRNREAVLANMPFVDDFLRNLEAHVMEPELFVSNKLEAGALSAAAAACVATLAEDEMVAAKVGRMMEADPKFAFALSAYHNIPMSVFQQAEKAIIQTQDTSSAQALVAARQLREIIIDVMVSRGLPGKAPARPTPVRGSGTVTDAMSNGNQSFLAKARAFLSSVVPGDSNPSNSATSTPESSLSAAVVQSVFSELSSRDGKALFNVFDHYHSSIKRMAKASKKQGVQQGESKQQGGGKARFSLQEASGEGVLDIISSAFNTITGQGEGKLEAQLEDSLRVMALLAQDRALAEALVSQRVLSTLGTVAVAHKDNLKLQAQLGRAIANLASHLPLDLSKHSHSSLIHISSTPRTSADPASSSSLSNLVLVNDLTPTIATPLLDLPKEFLTSGLLSAAMEWVKIPLPTEGLESSNTWNSEEEEEPEEVGQAGQGFWNRIITGFAESKDKPLDSNKKAEQRVLSDDDKSEESAKEQDIIRESAKVLINRGQKLVSLLKNPATQHDWELLEALDEWATEDLEVSSSDEKVKPDQVLKDSTVTVATARLRSELNAQGIRVLNNLTSLANFHAWWDTLLQNEQHGFKKIRKRDGAQKADRWGWLSKSVTSIKNSIGKIDQAIRGPRSKPVIREWKWNHKGELYSQFPLLSDELFLLFPRGKQADFGPHTGEELKAGSIRGNPVQDTDLSSMPGHVDVVFIHGLLGHAMHTWRPSNERRVLRSTLLCWPRDWLPVDLAPFLPEEATLRILTIGYPSTFSTRQGGGKSLEKNSRESLNRLVRAGVGHSPVLSSNSPSALKLNPNQSPTSSKKTLPAPDSITPLPSISQNKIFWITHSAGGLLLKEMLVVADHSYKNSAHHPILDKTKGIVFYGVPHLGTGLSLLYSHPVLNFLYGTSSQLHDLTSGSPKLAVLNKVLQQLVVVHNIPVMSFGETKNTPLPPHSNSPIQHLVVPAQDADPGFGSFMAVARNHVDICEPRTRRDVCYRALLRFLTPLVQSTSNAYSPSPSPSITRKSLANSPHISPSRAN